MPPQEPRRSAPTGTFRIDPTFRLAAVALGVAGVALVAAIVVATPEGDRARASLFLAPLVLLFVGLAVVGAVARIDFDGETLAKRGPFTTRSLRVDEITDVRYLATPRTQNRFRVHVRSARARSSIRFDPELWDRTADLVLIARALDPANRPDPVTRRLDDEERADLRRQIRGDGPRSFRGG